MRSLKNNFFKIAGLVAAAWLNCTPAKAQQAYYIDGYHGGVWGHYPDWNTRFMVDMLNKHPKWKINLEIEPETWDRASRIDPQAFTELKTLMADQSVNGRIEYVSPAYGQSYMYNIEGESIIRQLGYGIQNLRGYFPGIKFSTYSSEEPCFTNALPGILKSYGFKYASLKNPNTCFGGYTRAFGGELVNWIGPDGSSIITSPRYAIEKLEPKSTWQTIAWNNSPSYINAAFKYGMAHPIGMTLQDAGWKGGPFLGHADSAGFKSEYTTWRNYFENVTANDKRQDWKVSQEDILVSLVWGSQVTQQIAQRVRAAENKLLTAEKLSALSKLIKGTQWPQAGIDSAWRTLLLSQHHDCWIVPYNGKKGDTWADKVIRWTGNSNRISDSLANITLQTLSTGKASAVNITVVNTQAHKRTGLVSVAIPKSFKQNLFIKDAAGKIVPSQISKDSILFEANVPSFGYSTYTVAQGKAALGNGTKAVKLTDGKYRMESDLYRLIIDPAKGGRISSLIVKASGKEMVDTGHANSFNTLRGNFYNDVGFKTTSSQQAIINIIEQGPVRALIQIKSNIAGTDVTQTISLTQGEPVIDMHLNIDWQRNVGVGEDVDRANYKWTDYEKPFYNDSNKLVAVFPLNLTGQKVYKNAPFEVTESKLKNTFFDSWDNIKNNVILNWVDVTDNAGKYGMALFTDHTTSYTHGENFPLGLVVQYSGMGLWGRNYTTNGLTHIHYAIMPHTGKWNAANVWAVSEGWNQPLTAAVTTGKPVINTQSLISLTDSQLVLSSAQSKDGNLLLRFFNAGGQSDRKHVALNFKYKSAELVELDGRLIKKLNNRSRDKQTIIDFEVPGFGFKTVKLKL
ncbi:glycoside hydrolase family 38 C-terminal domain-containing protein [Mucilaginibacter litoreus]|uniref:Glycoside hydrolase family 38 C-terminal domain-containing protein n=1 Tax=Mucilaginibacter litoreus TaxID=1048221 RepID=A0ABW3AQL6_9SPHI